MKLQVGDPRIKWEAFRDTQDEKEVQVTEGEETRTVGQTTEEVQAVNYNGRSAWRREQVLRSDDLGDRRVVLLVDKRTFAPLYVEARFSRFVDQYDYLEKPLEEPAFDLYAVEMMLRLLPLAEGFAAEISCYQVAERKTVVVSVQVQGREPVATGRREEVDAWRVAVDFGYAEQEYWVTVEPQELLKQRNVLHDGRRMEFVRVDPPEVVEQEVERGEELDS
ncbi:MAG TPA: hypothetical protein VFV52_14400 [Bacilli bacterium]|nr:hypothetical protein [Bacilli bacterium]